MEKKLIQFDEASYNRDIISINRIADKVNENMNLLIDDNDVTIDFIKKLVYFTPKVYQYFNPKVYHFNLISKSVSLLGAVPPPTGKRAFLF